MNNFQQFNVRPTILKGHPVTSLEEARASLIDFDGSIFYFPDAANKCIYTKQVNMDGTVSFYKYEQKEIPVETSLNTNAYITREEFEKAISELKNASRVKSEIKF